MKKQVYDIEKARRLYRIKSEEVHGRQALAQGQLSNFHNRRLGIRSRLEDKVAVQIDRHNEKIKKEQPAFVDKIKEALPNVIAQKVTAGIVLLVLIILGIAVRWVCQRAPGIEI